MKHHATAASAGSTQATGSSRGLIRLAAVTRDASEGSNGSGAPSSRRLRATLAVLALAIAAFVVTAAPALAAVPPKATTPVISDVSYTSAKVVGKISTDGSGSQFGSYTAWAFQYSTDQIKWSTGFYPGFGELINGPATEKEVKGTISVPKGETKYFVRLVAANGVFVPDPPQAISPGPNPSFTTLAVDPPSVILTEDASDVVYTTATVKGEVNRPANADPAFDVDCHFQYVTDAQFKATGFQSPGEALCEPEAEPAEAPIHTAGPSKVAAKIAGLTNGTTYHLRLFVSNASLTTDAKEAASTFTTVTVDPPTVVSIDDATDVFSRSANAAGVIKRSANPDPAFDIIACQFEYVTQAQFAANGFKDAGTTGCVEPINNGLDEETSVTAALSGLEPETIYHLRLAAGNAAAAPGTKEAANTFTTTAKVAKPTVIKVDNATGVDQDSAKVSGVVERPAGVDPALDVTCRAEYVSGAAFQGNEEQRLLVITGGGSYTVGFEGASTSPLAFNAPAASVQAALAGLPGIGAGNVSVRGGPGSYTGTSPYLIVFTGALAGKDVEALTTDPGGLDGYGAGLLGVADLQTVAEGGHPPGFVNPGRTDCDPLAPEVGPQEAKVGIFGLQPDTTYHLRLTAENGGGTDTKDAAATFTTPQNYPASAVLGPITEVSYGGAKLSGETDAEGVFSTPVYEVSTDGVNWSSVVSEGGGGGGGGVKLEPFGPIVITGLKGATKYFVRIRIVNINDIGGPPLALSQPPHPSFTTLPVDPAVVLKADDATDVTAETAMVSGEIERPANPDPAFDANCRFEYVTDAQFQANGYQGARETPCGIDPLTNPGEKKAVEAELTELRSGTKYHLRLTATNAGPDASLEAANTFTTIAVPATVTATAGGSDNEGGYVLSGIVNPNNSTITDCKFVYGPTSEVDYKNYAFAVPCSPLPNGTNERQRVRVETEGPGTYKLSFGGDITGDIPWDAPAPVVQVALESLSSIGSGGVSEVTRTGGIALAHYLIYNVTFSGPLGGMNLPLLQVKPGSESMHGGVGVSTITEGHANTPITVEGHVTGLTPDATYHFRLVAINAFGIAVTPDREFIPTIAAKEDCPANEQLRAENNSLALPECRAYEMVTPPGKEGFGAALDSYDGGDRVGFTSLITNLAKSGQGNPLQNFYVAERTAAGWKTIPNLNGSSGSLLDAPNNFKYSPVAPAYSSDLLSSVWNVFRPADFGTPRYGMPSLRSPDGTFADIGTMNGGLGALIGPGLAMSADLSHVVNAVAATEWGPGVYEYIGTGNDQPRRVDVDNSGAPIPSCPTPFGDAQTRSLSSDGTTVIFRTFGGCGAANPPAGKIWARVNGTTTFDVSASHCNRSAADPGGVCNGPTEPGGCVEEFYAPTSDIEGFGCRTAKFAAATPDGSRIFFTTTQQLVNSDTDQTNDIYACDLPSGNPAPSADKANPCASFIQVSGAQTGADVESVNATSEYGALNATSENGATVLFTARGKLADNEDALKQKAVAGDHNLYLWRADASHPDGQTAFVGRLDSAIDSLNQVELRAQATPDGRYLVFTTASQLLKTDTDTVRDVYRYDADTGELIRVSTNVFGVAGNVDGLDATIPGSAKHHLTTAISDDGTRIVFTTVEALSPADGNAEPDIYLWTPARVFLLSTGSSGFAPKSTGGNDPDEPYSPKVAISPSGEDIYFESSQQLSPADPDGSNDVYDARIGGGFSFAQPPTCTGETCQPEPTPAPLKTAPHSGQPGLGNPPQPKLCPKGKVRKKSGRCVKKPKRHSGKKHSGKKAGHKQRGGK